MLAVLVPFVKLLEDHEKETRYKDSQFPIPIHNSFQIPRISLCISSSSSCIGAWTVDR